MGDKVKALREQLELSIEEFELKTGVSHIEDIENGNMELSDDAIEQICKSLAIEDSYFLENTEELRKRILNMINSKKLSKAQLKEIFEKAKSLV